MQSENAAGYDEISEQIHLGQQDKIVREKIDQRIRPYFLITGFLFVFLMLELYRWHMQVPPMPVVVLALFAVSLVLVAVQLKDYKDHFRFLRLGKKGEPNTADVIHKHSQETGSTIYKNVVLGETQIDYVIAGHSGVTLVNICDWRIPSNNEALIHYDNEQILLNGYRPDANPIEPLKRVKQWMENKLYASLSKPINVQCLVVFPEWFVRSPERSVDVWVINPREMSEFLQQQKLTLSDNDNCLLNYHLAKLVNKKMSRGES